MKVGYSTDPADPANRWRFVAREAGLPKPGNDNAGHDYGNAALSDADCYAIIEYLKTL
ncbi:hypothetical protein [Dankookia sp. P2]|uniref:hypothetical protein n=1 Tax=Dankookia sp. P2 TaxID=3423955 RepID=UPI003D67FDDC